MSEFVAALADHAFLRYALMAGLLASISCGVIGGYVAVRRITYIAGGIAHCVLAGLGAARYLQVVYGWEWLHPLYGAVAVALLAAVTIAVVRQYSRQSEDTIISALWAIGMAVGILFIWKTPGYSENLMSYLFGNILMVGPQELWMLAGLDAVVVTLGVLFYKQLLAICFDEEFARLRGLNVEAYYLMLLCLTALTVVVLVPVVGLVMVIALLSLPVAVAGRFASSLSRIMVIAAILSALFTTSGLIISFNTNMPAGATAIVIAGIAYLLVTAGKRMASDIRIRRA